MSKVHRVVVPIDSHDPEAWQVALAYADKICEVESVTNVVLLVHTKAQLKDTDLSGFVGTMQAKRLDRGESLSLPSGARLKCQTLRTAGTILPADTVVLAYWADADMLDAIDGMRNVAGVVVVPEFPGNAKIWEDRWNPIIHGQAAKPASSSLIGDPVVEEALGQLSRLINLSTGLVNPRDKEQADAVLRILRNKGHNADPQKVKSWAIQNGWRPQDADDLARLSAKIFALRTKPSLSKIYNAEERYARWQP